ncbi:amidohydrolase [Agrobacterium vitis]|uniref:M20 aminoacylase family protein n=1 Tax=Rhizobium/Agrobacterium group TaxID=227290 RepID=UPI0008DC20CE|nr:MULTISPECIES: M20 aminoacylase family protein [Rhizobium/Agrobacterium group]MCF1432577.1 amidohydrolase [Allorhizobium ampelinum]MUO87887.1 amidohydrolase [Agrobacterium vitis]MUZ50984.1 amidohydrolase [Agrobacterium vitis]MUZ90688.1 amidohydrolase [Agrobacterium vitis]MVA38635.1 amidohydrolase [Agrobacterium vitis]
MNIAIDSHLGQDRVAKKIRAYLDEIIAFRRELHQNPELAFQEKRTSNLVVSYLASFGYQVEHGIAGTGIVASLKKGSGSRIIGLRADMDALPIHEATGLAHASRTKDVMHACGHDGHTAILVAAARYLAETSEFDGTVRLIFQPAEEIGAGAKKLLAEGLFERFPVDAVFGLHNWPDVPAGHFGFVPGPAMASVDQAHITVVGKGGHGAEPHRGVDPVLASASLITALQSIVSRNVDPREMAVITVGSIHGGSASNVIPESVDLKLTVRTFSEDVRQQLSERIPALARAQAESFGARAEVDYRFGFPPVLNHADETAFARQVAVQTFGDDRVIADFKPRTASEDFAFLLQARPGSYLFVGNGDSAPLHSASYDFNDEIILPAAHYWVRLVESYLSSPVSTATL